MIAWDAIETALHDAIAAAVTPIPVIWSDQDAGQPAARYITLRIGDRSIVGAIANASLTDLARPAGQEIEQRASTWQACALTIQAFSAATLGADSAAATLGMVRSRLHLPSVQAALAAVGVSLSELGPVQNLSALEGADFEGRALLDARFLVFDAESEFTTYIETAVLNGTAVLAPVT